MLGFIDSKIIEIVRSVAKQKKIHPVKLEKFLHRAELDVSVVRVHSLVRGLALGHVVERQLSRHSDSLQYFHAVLSHSVYPGEVIVYMLYVICDTRRRTINVTELKLVPGQYAVLDVTGHALEICW